jgi:hypothetical protein
VVSSHYRFGVVEIAHSWERATASRGPSAASEPASSGAR